MQSIPRTALGILCFSVGTMASAASSTDPLKGQDSYWPSWRGPLSSGVAPHADPPLHWSESRNLRWKKALPGLGHSSPLVWGDRVYVTTAVPHGDASVGGAEEGAQRHDHAPGAHDNLDPDRRQRFVVFALDRSSGKVLWETTVRDAVPHEGIHVTGSWASASPVTDGEHVYASFGSEGIYCLDWKGQVVWQVDLGQMDTRHGHGEGSSPAMHGETLVVNWDHQGGSFLVALNKRSGKQRWRVERDEITSWSTPLIVEHAGKQQVIVSATGHSRGHDLADGKLIWEAGGLSRNVVASPVAADGFVYVANSYDWQMLQAIRLADAKGDVSDTEAIAWKRGRDTPYVPSPLLYEGRLYYLKHNHGFLTNLDAKTGRLHYGPQRLGGMQMIFASPVAAAGRIYISSRNGTTLVVRHGDKYEELTRNVLNDSFSASAAIAGKQLFLRGEKHLYCLEQSESPAAD